MRRPVSFSIFLTIAIGFAEGTFLSHAFGAGRGGRCDGTYADTLWDRVYSEPSREWRDLDEISRGPERAGLITRFFDRWVALNPAALRDFARRLFDSLIHREKVSQEEFLAEKAGTEDALSKSLEALHFRELTFGTALDVLSRGRVEIVLTSHPTEIRSEDYRRRWQEYAKNPSASTREALRASEPGASRRQTLEEEIGEAMNLYVPNIYSAISEIRAKVLREMGEIYGKDAEFDLDKLRRAVDRSMELGTWVWDADGKSAVNAKTMGRLDGIQQSGLYRLHAEKAERLPSEFAPIARALRAHSEAVAKDSMSTEITKQRPELDRPTLPPSTRVQRFFENWTAELGSGHQAEELRFAIRHIRINRHMRQNAAVLNKAVEQLKSAGGRSTETLTSELDRLAILAKDPSPGDVFISADTKTLQDSNNALILLKESGLLGKVRYFPLIENLGTFRNLPEIVREWLKPGTLMSRHIRDYADRTGQVPELNLMFAQSDTSRLGGQGANHLLEIQAQLIQDVASRAYGAPIVVSVFWGGGSQLARGGDWYSDRRAIHTDQGNARELKYSSPAMARYRLGRHLGFAIENAAGLGPRLENSMAPDRERLLVAVAKREARYTSLFFDPAGHRNALEAYLLFGSMLNEARSNSYGARPTSRSEDSQRTARQRAHRLSDRLFGIVGGVSLESLVADMGQSAVLNMRLEDLWRRLQPGRPYDPPSIDQRAITNDNAFSETKFNLLAESLHSELEAGIDANTSARWLQSQDAALMSYRRQKVAEVLATETLNLSGHIARLPESLRPLVNEPGRVQSFLAETRGKRAGDLTVSDLISTFAYIHQTIQQVDWRNRNVERALSDRGGENVLAKARAFAQNTLSSRARAVEFGEGLLAWMHRRGIFGGDASQTPEGLARLFSSIYTPPELANAGRAIGSDGLGQLEFLAWALHYEAQQLPVSVNELVDTD